MEQARRSRTKPRRKQILDEPPPFLGTWKRVYTLRSDLSGGRHFSVLAVHETLRAARLIHEPLDWVVLFGWLAFLVSYGLWRGRGSNSVNQFLLAGKTMPWYAMGLSIMATQASAITFISTTGQAYVDGMRFVQFYFGLPMAMVILSATAVPIFHRAKVYTAYEYLEQRFDAKTRAAGHRHFSDRPRPGRGHGAGGAGDRAVGDLGLAVRRDHR